MAQEFFRGLDWARLERKDLEPPYKPKVVMLCYILVNRLVICGVYENLYLYVLTYDVQYIIHYVMGFD